MKNIKSLTGLAFFFCCTCTVQAQQQEEKTPKPMPAALTKSPASDKPSADPAAKQIDADAKPAVPKPVAAAEEIKEDMKGNEIKPDDKKSRALKNIDRPKPSTIEPRKKTEPAAKPKSPVMVVPQG